MGKVFEGIDAPLREWIDRQHIFFISTAPLAADGMVNCSPKGYDCFRILGEREVAYLDLTGSGIETVAHVQENGRIVFMFCSYDPAPRIVRLHGRAYAHLVGSPEFDELVRHFEPEPGMRSIIRAELTRISDSCGYGVPRYRYLGERDTMREWALSKGDDTLREYRVTRNAHSLDNLPGVRSR